MFIVSDILESDHLPIIFHILVHVKIRKLSDPIEKFTDWDRFQSLAYELISPKIEMKSGVEADKAARNFSASIASAYRLSTNKITLCGMSLLEFVDIHYNKYSQFESQTIGEARRSSRSISWLAAELLALKRAIVSQSVGCRVCWPCEGP
jgi:hypothetical protein